MPAHLIFGAGGIGSTAKSFTFTWDTPEKVSELLSTLDRIGVRELDSAASYPPGNPWNTETLLGQSSAADKGFVIDSKVAAHVKGPTLHDEGIRTSIDRTLGLLGVTKIRTLYAHSPDSKTPLEDQAAAFDKQYRAGKFERASNSTYRLPAASSRVEPRQWLTAGSSSACATIRRRMWPGTLPFATRKAISSLLYTRGSTMPSFASSRRTSSRSFGSTTAPSSRTGEREPPQSAAA